MSNTLSTRNSPRNGWAGPTTTVGLWPTTGTGSSPTRMLSLKHAVSPMLYVPILRSLLESLRAFNERHPPNSPPLRCPCVLHHKLPNMDMRPGLTDLKTLRNGAQTRLVAGLKGAASRMVSPTLLPLPTGMTGVTLPGLGASRLLGVLLPTPAR